MKFVKNIKNMWKGRGELLFRLISKLVFHFRENGINETIRKSFFYVKLKRKGEIITNKDNLYKIKKKNKKNIISKKNKTIIIISREPYYYNHGKHYSAYYARYLNELGYQVKYYYKDKTIKNTFKLILPVISHEIINMEIDKFLKSNNIIILDKSVKNSVIIKRGLKIIEYENNLIGLNQQKEIIYNKCLETINNNKIKTKEFYNNLSIIILNYNNKKIIEICIDSLLKYNDNYKYEIIVVDNQSSDGSYENILKKYNNKIKIIQNVKNGCSSGRNLGVSLSTKKYLMFLDSDQWILHSFWLHNYFEIFEREPDVGAIGWAAGWFNKKGYAEQVSDNFLYRYMPPWGLYRYDIGYLGTGGMMMKKNVFDKINGFDINYDPTCYEDTDISLKIRDAGYKLVYCPYLGIKHLPHQTTQSGSESHQKLIQEKGNYFVNKWLSQNKNLLTNKKYRK